MSSYKRYIIGSSSSSSGSYHLRQWYSQFDCNCKIYQILASRAYAAPAKNEYLFAAFHAQLNSVLSQILLHAK
jgi:hypothetical protein